MSLSINLNCSDVSVDSGMIMVSDKNCYKNYGYIDKYHDRDLNYEFKVSPGKYKCLWSINNSYNGPIAGSKEIEITSGILVVSDPCYLIEEECWSRFLDDTDLGDDPLDGSFIIDEQGGDGSFHLLLTLTPIQEFSCQ